MSAFLVIALGRDFLVNEADCTIPFEHFVLPSLASTPQSIENLESIHGILQTTFRLLGVKTTRYEELRCRRSHIRSDKRCKLESNTD